MTYAAIPDSIFQTVKALIVDALAVEPDEVTLGSRLVDDLGADSLDFVDIVFQLDQELDIKVRDGEFNFLTRLDFSSPEVMQEGFLTEPVIAELEKWLPAIAEQPDRMRITPQQLFSLITVEAICIVAARRAPAE
ncbi:MAG: acyl carrier protein [Polyangiaceae bacterium]|nr:acyl carrier protein [Myxococcales bacterium]MCB9590707.1 acyl carrier protein [Polyangiaceae bacterium]